jgi:hypothetical protein
MIQYFFSQQNNISRKNHQTDIFVSPEWRSGSVARCLHATLHELAQACAVFDDASITTGPVYTTCLLMIEPQGSPKETYNNNCIPIKINGALASDDARMASERHISGPTPSNHVQGPLAPPSTSHAHHMRNTRSTFEIFRCTTCNMQKKTNETLEKYV